MIREAIEGLQLNIKILMLLARNAKRKKVDPNYQ